MLRDPRRDWTPDRKFEDVPITAGSLTIGSCLQRKKAGYFCKDAVGHGLDSAYLLYCGIDGRCILNGHEVDGVECFQQRKAAVPPLGVAVQSVTQGFDHARRQSARLVIGRLRHALEGRDQSCLAIALETLGDGADGHRLTGCLFVRRDRIAQQFHSAQAHTCAIWTADGSLATRAAACSAI
jgi:hypothetical protein